jgi:hypothetical protein
MEIGSASRLITLSEETHSSLAPDNGNTELPVLRVLRQHTQDEVGPLNDTHLWQDQNFIA